jgi:prepilin-type N-terminal cleavage/methylation domain-containing protein
MRRAFTLIELLVVVTVLPFVMVAVSGVYATFIRDIPQTTRILQENVTVLHLLEQIRRDVDGAVGLPPQFEGQRADERTLLIEQPGRVIRYQWEDRGIVRTLLTNPPSDEERLWRMRDAVLAWRLWGSEDRAHAVEIHSHTKQRVAGRLREKLANSHVFFLRGSGPHGLGTLAQEGQVQ